MSANKWTAGPWAPGHMTDPETTCECRYILSNGAGYFGSVAVVSKNNGLRVGEGGNDCPPEEEAIANAHLIAAAPDLHHSLKSIVEIIERDSGLIFNNRGQWLYAANYALAKARGEQPK